MPNLNNNLDALFEADAYKTAPQKMHLEAATKNWITKSLI